MRSGGATGQADLTNDLSVRRSPTDLDAVSADAEGNKCGGTCLKQSQLQFHRSHRRWFRSPCRATSSEQGTQGGGDVQPVVGTKGSVSRTTHPEMSGVTLKNCNWEASLTPGIRSYRCCCCQTNRQQQGTKQLRAIRGRATGHDHRSVPARRLRSRASPGDHSRLRNCCSNPTPIFPGGKA